jgi:Transposase DDE domain
MIDTSIVRVHQHAASIDRNKKQSIGRSRGGLTRKIHAAVDTNGLPVRLALIAGEAHDNRLAAKVVGSPGDEPSQDRTPRVARAHAGSFILTGIFGWLPNCREYSNFPAFLQD